MGLQIRHILLLSLLLHGWKFGTTHAENLDYRITVVRDHPLASSAISVSYRKGIHWTTVAELKLSKNSAVQTTTLSLPKDLVEPKLVSTDKKTCIKSLKISSLNGEMCSKPSSNTKCKGIWLISAASECSALTKPNAENLVVIHVTSGTEYQRMTILVFLVCAAFSVPSFWVYLKRRNSPRYDAMMASFMSVGGDYSQDLAKKIEGQGVDTKVTVVIQRSQTTDTDTCSNDEFGEIESDSLETMSNPDVSQSEVTSVSVPIRNSV
eukprot:392924_1